MILCSLLLELYTCVSVTYFALAAAELQSTNYEVRSLRENDTVRGPCQAGARVRPRASVCQCSCGSTLSTTLHNATDDELAPAVTVLHTLDAVCNVQLASVPSFPSYSRELRCSTGVPHAAARLCSRRLQHRLAQSHIDALDIECKWEWVLRREHERDANVVGAVSQPERALGLR